MNSLSEVTQFDTAILGNEKVARIDIEMNESFFMNVLNSTGHIRKDSPNFFFRKEDTPSEGSIWKFFAYACLALVRNIWQARAASPQHKLVLVWLALKTGKHHWVSLTFDVLSSYNHVPAGRLSTSKEKIVLGSHDIGVICTTFRFFLTLLSAECDVWIFLVFFFFRHQAHLLTYVVIQISPFTQFTTNVEITLFFPSFDYADTVLAVWIVVHIESLLVYRAYLESFGDLLPAWVAVSDAHIFFFLFLNCT